MTRSTVTVSFQDLESGTKTRYWYRWELLERFGISEATFKRDLELLIPFKEFQYIPRAETFSDFQRYCLEHVHSLYCQGLNKLQVKFELKKGLPVYDTASNVSRSQSTAKRQRRRRSQSNPRSRQQIGK